MLFARTQEYFKKKIFSCDSLGLPGNTKMDGFLATLVALHFTLVSKSVSESVSRSFKLA